MAKTRDELFDLATEYDEELFKKRFAKLLKQTRKESGFTQEDFAHIMGVSSTTYKKLESCRVLPGVKALWRLSEITGRSMEYFSGKEGEGTDTVWTMVSLENDLSKLNLLMRLVRYFGFEKFEDVVEQIKREMEGK